MTVKHRFRLSLSLPFVSSRLRFFVWERSLKKREYGSDLIVNLPQISFTERYVLVSTLK